MKRRVLKYLVLISFLVLFLSTISSLFVYYNNYSKVEQENLFKMCHILKIGADREEDKLSYLEELSKNTKSFRISLIDKNGQVLFDTYENPKFLPTHKDRPEFQNAKKFGFAQSKRFSTTLSTDSYYVSFLLNNDQVLRLSKEVDSIMGAFLKILPLLLTISFAIFLIGILVASHFTRKTLEPLINVKGSLTDFNIDEFPEISPFIMKINSQNELIEKNLRQIKREKDTIETILSNMKESLVIIDENRQLLSVNKSALNLFNSSNNIIGKNILNLIRDDSILKFVEEALSGKNSEEIIKIGTREYKSYVNPVFEATNVRGVILLFIDETESIRALRLRDEFSSNVSHELKTPLTSICGFSELLANNMVDSDETKKEFYQLIYRDSKRLLNLVEDIMKISGLEKEATFVRENINLRELIEEIFNTQKIEIEKRNIKTKLMGQGIVYENKTMMWELFSNLVNNGIKYNKDNGNLDILIKEDNDKVIVEVVDSGIGISSDDLERIFERFYRVDKSRSKKIGGTGLGLSIVKHVLSSIDGDVEVSSKMGLGTKFTLSLYKNRKE